MRILCAKHCGSLGSSIVSFFNRANNRHSYQITKLRLYPCQFMVRMTFFFVRASSVQKCLTNFKVW